MAPKQFKKSTWLLVDFDNTQQETEEHVLPSLIARFNQFYATEVGEPMTLELFREQWHGKARQSLCALVDVYYTNKLGRPFVVDYDLWYERREERVLEGMMNVKGGLKMAPGLLETLTSRQQQGVGLALVTNSPLQRCLGAMLFADNGKGRDLARLFGANMFAAGDQQKPKPDVYLRAMAQLGTDAGHCIAVEDSATGVQSAVAAGITCYGFTGFTYGTAKQKLAEKLIAAGCKACFDDWHNFEAVVDGGVRTRKAA